MWYSYFCKIVIGCRLGTAKPQVVLDGRTEHLVKCGALREGEVWEQLRRTMWLWLSMGPHNGTPGKWNQGLKPVVHILVV